MRGFGDYFFKGFITFGLICLIIALSTYFTGCNPNVENGCISYNPFDPGYIYDHKIEKDRCKKCVSRNNGKCKSYHYYDCYTSTSSPSFEQHFLPCLDLVTASPPVFPPPSSPLSSASTEDGSSCMAGQWMRGVRWRQRPER